MKHIITWALVVVVASTGVCQMPFPSVRYTEDNFHALQLFSGQRPTNKLEIQTDQNTGQQMTHLQDAASREFIVEEAVIDPGFSCEPAPGSVGEFKIILGHRSDMEGAWFEPINYFPQLYEKIEWGVKLPDEVEAAIDNWIWNDQHPTDPPLSPALNPFDPEQIDLRAIVDYTTSEGVYHSQPVFGFFYQPFSRNTVYNNPHNENLDDPDNWYWDELTTPYRFRFRWSSTVISHHSVRIKLDVPSMGHWEMEPFEFDSYWGDPRKSFISVTDNGHYFKTDDGHVYFPVGLNINEGTFGCNCMEGYADNDTTDLNDGFCAECYEWAEADPCCGIRRNKRSRSGISPEFDSAGTSLGVQGYTLAPAAYVKLERILETLQQKGGNSFRTLIDPTQYDLEFEKLNNYYDRQYQAWEIDKMLEKCNELNLRIEFNMMIHYAVCSHHDGYDKFDWDYSQNCYGCGDEAGNNGTNGYCYWRELGLDTPIDFITDSLAIANYKKKIRYFIARYGYSKNIFLFELLSEANNIGKVWLAENGTDLNSDGDTNDYKVVTENPYSDNAEIVRPAVAAWHHEIARYIKEDLKHTKHLIAADYTGAAPMSFVDLNNNSLCDGSPEICNACQQPYFDDSWHSNTIDVIAWNNYSNRVPRWEKMANHEYKKTIQSDGLICGWDNPDSVDLPPYFSPLNGYSSIWKPVIYPECGLAECMGQDHTGFVLDLLAGPFSGHATTGMSWDEWSQTTKWNYFQTIKSFLESKVLNAVDIGTGNWQPGHSYSKHQQNDINVNNLAPKNAEILYLHNDNDQAELIVGIIINRSWNHYTVCGCGEIDESPEENFLNEFYECGFSNDPIWIFQDALGLHNYTIRYFDPFTLTKLNEINRFSAIAAITIDNQPVFTKKLALEDYPLMYDGSNGHQPFYFFTIHRAGNEFENTQFINNENEFLRIESNITPSQLTNAIQSLNSVTSLKISPSPAINLITISSSEDLIGDWVTIINSQGNLIQKVQITENEQCLDINQLSSGLYWLKVNDKQIQCSFLKIQ